MVDDRAFFSCGHATLCIRGFVGSLVSWLVGRSVRGHESKSEETCISAPANPSATGGRVSGLVNMPLTVGWSSR